MAKKKGNKKPDKRGAKCKYRDDFPFLAEGLARRGLSDKQIAEMLGISQDTFYSYVKRFPEFSEALERGKAPVDVLVENALLKNALGYDYDEEVTRIYRDDSGKEIKEIKRIKKHYPGSFSAQSFWLTNRLKDLWKKEQKDEGSNDESLQDVLNEFAKALKHGDK